MNISEPIVLITTIKIKPEARDAFAAWQEKMNSTVGTFSGFVSLEMLSPQPDRAGWLSVQRFRSTKEMSVWRLSEERQKLFEEVKPLLIEDAESIIEVESCDPHKIKSVTEVFVTHVKPDKYDAYRKWASKIQQVESQFTGYQGVYIQAPGKEEGNPWITILSFDTPEHLNAWLTSEQRKEILKEAESSVEALYSHRVEGPFAGWFANISKTGEPPAVWKQTMLILLVLFPIVMMEIKYLNPLIAGLNISLSTFIGNAISVTLVSWPMMPLTIYFLKWWLVPEPKQKYRDVFLGTLIVIALYLIEIFCLWNFL